jgi:hypothetical protein
MSTPADHDLETFLAHYVICALWSSHDESREDGGDPMDDNYGPGDIHPDTLAKMREECRAFMESDAWREAYVGDFWTLEQGGHDFWLTRNGHGAGFWDRYSGGHEGEAHGKALSALAETFGGVDLYVGDDGKVHA